MQSRLLRSINRNRIQFSLRALFVLLTAAAVGAAWLGRSYHEYRAEQAVIAGLSNAYVLRAAFFEDC